MIKKISNPDLKKFHGQRWALIIDISGWCSRTFVPNLIKERFLDGSTNRTGNIKLSVHPFNLSC